MDRFDNSMEHLLAEAKRIDLLLRREIVKMRQLRSDGKWDEFRGLYISEEDIDGVLSASILASSPPSKSSDDPEAKRMDQLLGEYAAEVAQRKAESLRNGVSLRLEHLRQAFDLSAFEIDTLLIALLPELDLRYQRLYAYLQDDVTKKSPTVDTVLKVLGSSPEEKSAIRSAFQPRQPLMRYHLVSLGDTSSGKASPLLERPIRVEPRIVDYLLGSDQVDSRLQSFVCLVKPSVTLSEVLLPAEVRERLLNAISREMSRQGAILFLHGPHGSGKRMTAEALCREWETPLLVINTALMMISDIPVDLATTLVLREASLHQACPYWDRFGLLLGEDKDREMSRHTIMDHVAGYPGIVFFGADIPWEPEAPSQKSVIRIDLPVPPFDIRRELWRISLDKNTPPTTDIDLGALATKFRFTGGQIRGAVADARNRALGQAGDGEQITTNDLYRACRAQSNQRLTALARKIEPKFTWEDMVLPKEQMVQLREIASYVRYRHVVFGEWNFDRKVSLGRGLNILFAGPSGTGKTMSAEIIAGELSFDLYKIDLSTVVSKYIGETEKNLDRIFREAQDSNAILFFDEADAIFGKRSEVRDSHDRYANIEVAYLLQKMEEYEGIVILATNLRKNLDEAFARRMQFCIEFPLPDEADRHRIWQGMFPSEAPLSANADLGFMARQFKITGGNIKNIALGAAFLAASDGGVIATEHLIKATKREYQKIGRLCTEADFAPYFELVKG
jgi:SpoVK/Ycf46/Vps4 family AAA+-type ATPase